MEKAYRQFPFSKKSIISLAAGVASSTNGILILSSKLFLPPTRPPHQRKLPQRDKRIISRLGDGFLPFLLAGLQKPHVGSKSGFSDPCIQDQMQLACPAARSIKQLISSPANPKPTGFTVSSQLAPEGRKSTKRRASKLRRERSFSYLAQPVTPDKYL